MRICVAIALVMAGCGHQRPLESDANGGGGGGGGGGGIDSGPGIDGNGSGHDAAGLPDAYAGVISGGPCMSGAAGQTAYRIRWAGQSGSSAYPVYEVDGLPDHSRDHAGAYGYTIPFTSSFVDPFLGVGGLQLDDSDFVDLEITTAGVSSISQATLSIFGRSYNTTASGSFNWQTLVDTGESPTDFVSNVAPYQWYSADATSAIDAGDGSMLIRIKSGPSSDALVVNRIELCLVAN